MSQAQLDAVIVDIERVFGSWGPETSLDEMRSGWDGLFGDVPRLEGVRAEAVDAGGVKAEWITAPGASEDRAILYLHGGGYVLGSIDSHRGLCEGLSLASGSRVLALDYRLAPEHPFPAAVDDATAAYRWLLAGGMAPERIAISGDSAGGGLTFATLVALRDDGQPLPGCATPLSPWVDLEATGESVTSRSDLDPMVNKEMLVSMGQTYVAGGSTRDPLAAPLYADLAGLPPVLVHVGSRETLHDDAGRMLEKARKAGVDVTLKVWDGQIHVFQLFADRLDEGQRAVEELGDFIRKHTS